MKVKEDGPTRKGFKGFLREEVKGIRTRVRRPTVSPEGIVDIREDSEVKKKYFKSS